MAANQLSLIGIDTLPDSSVSSRRRRFSLRGIAGRRVVPAPARGGPACLFLPGGSL